MNKQEIEKAIRILKMYSSHVADINIDAKNAFTMAISTLEKQIPKSPYQDEDGIWECPNCESQLDDVNNYCEICGRRLMAEVAK